MKKLVLAALILLASVVGLLSMAGCKNDSVPEVTPAKLVSITVTPPIRTVYSLGESFDGSDMVVTATYEDGETREVTGWTTNFDEVTREKGLKKEVTVSYTEGDNKKTATFTVDVVDPSVPTELTSYISPSHTDDTWTYMAFGEWPQTKANVEGISLQQVVGGRGYFKDNYYMDGKGNYYVKVTANPYSEYYKYSDKSNVTEGSEVYFKVEPIIWRVLNKDYSESKKALLWTENILTGGIPYYSVYKVNRTIEGAEIYPNNYEHSQIRAFLNGLSYAYKDSNSAEQIQKSEYEGIGFLQTAFTEKAQKEIIVDTEVDNSARSTSDAEEKLPQATDCACVNTTDKIFLLSEQEATSAGYGFAEYTAYGEGNTRIRVTTDYAKATGVYVNGLYGGRWCLRSPRDETFKSWVLIINTGGYIGYSCSVTDIMNGIVPALSISINGN